MHCVCVLIFSVSFFLSACETVEKAIMCPDILLAFFRDLSPAPTSVRKCYVSASKKVHWKVEFKTCLISNLVEFICFVIIICEMYKHHKKHVKLCLSDKPEKASKKKRRNAITALGHLVSWLTEIFIFVGMQHTYWLLAQTFDLTLFHWTFFKVFPPSIDYVVFSGVHAASSKDLRAHVFDLDYLICVSVRCKPKKEDEVAEEIELQDMPNGSVIQP